MADHVRKQIRDAVATRVTGLATTGARVFAYRVDPLQMGNLPGLTVWTPADAAESQTIHAPKVYERDIEIHVAAIVAGVGDIDGALDAVAKEVETALGAAITVGGKSLLLEYRGAQIEYTRGEKTVGECDMEYTAKVYTAGNAPDVLL